MKLQWNGSKMTVDFKGRRVEPGAVIDVPPDRADALMAADDGWSAEIAERSSPETEPEAEPMPGSRRRGRHSK